MGFARFSASLCFVAASVAFGQTNCPPTPTFSPCDIVFDLPAAAVVGHPNPFASVEFRAEFRSPRSRVLSIPGFWDGDGKFVLRFSPTEPGNWVYRVTSNVPSLNGQSGSVAATDSGKPGFIRRDNTHHFSYSAIRKPHLWMGDTVLNFGSMDRSEFDRLLAARAKDKFNHIRGMLMSADTPAFQDGRPNFAYFRELDARILAMNKAGIFTDVILADANHHLTKLFPTLADREHFLRYAVARYSAMMVTWHGLRNFDSYSDSRKLMQEFGATLKRLDAYQHVRTTSASITSAPLIPDDWMDLATYQTEDFSVGSIERQLLTMPSVGTFQDTKGLWNVTMNGQYPIHSGPALDAAASKAMSAWFEFFEKTRYWELQPFFEVDGGRALSLTGIEYIVYLEKPGTVEVVTEKHGYDVYWFRPSTGELIKQKKGFDGERFSGQPPDTRSDWVLHLSRDGKKQGMLNSYKFESQTIAVQEVERIPAKVPFEIVEPAVATAVPGKPITFKLKLVRETRATGSMKYLWTAEATTEGQGYRVVGTGTEGQFSVPGTAVVNLRLYGMNLNGKVYQLDRVLRVTP